MYVLFCRIFKVAFLVGLLHLSAVATAAVSEAPAIHLPAIEGKLDLGELRGKVVYLDFWASWCKPCQESFPWMHEMKARYQQQGFEVVAVNLDKDKALADAFLQKMTVNFVVAFDASGGSAADYKLKGMPSSYLIGRDGKLYGTHAGFLEKDKAMLEGAIQKLLAN